MKYLNDYLKEVLLIQPLGEVTFEEECSSDGEILGLNILINKKDIGITVWYADYADYLEEKFDQFKKDYNIVN